MILLIWMSVCFCGCRAIQDSICFHNKGSEETCGYDDTYNMLVFGAIQVVLSQIPNFHNIEWLSIVAAIMSFAYAFIGMALAIVKVNGNLSFSPISWLLMSLLMHSCCFKAFSIQHYKDWIANLVLKLQMFVNMISEINVIPKWFWNWNLLYNLSLWKIPRIKLIELKRLMWSGLSISNIILEFRWLINQTVQSLHFMD